MKNQVMQFRKLIFLFAAALMSAALAGCGGGGGGSAAAPTTYTAAAMAGELLTYTLDTANLTYTYTITDSMYGLTGTNR